MEHTGNLNKLKEILANCGMEQMVKDLNNGVLEAKFRQFSLQTASPQGPDIHAFHSSSSSPVFKNQMEFCVMMYGSVEIETVDKCYVGLHNGMETNTVFHAIRNNTDTAFISGSEYRCFNTFEGSFQNFTFSGYGLFPRL
jgi:hypothetical protein